MSHLLLDTMLKGLKGLVLKQTVSENGVVTTTYESRLGWATLLFKVIQECKDVNGGGNRFELIVPNERFARDPLLPDGATSIPSAKGRN